MIPAEKLVDVAIGKPTQQSSRSKWDIKNCALGVPGRLNTSPDFMFHTSKEENPWWMIDLLWIYPAEKITIHNRKKQCIERARSITIEVSCDAAKWTLIHAGLSYFGDSDSGDPLNLFLRRQIPFRYVRLSLNECEFFHLSKVEILVSPEQLTAAENTIPISIPIIRSWIVSPIRAAVLGTSNSVRRGGYVVALESPAFTVIRNVSLGSSHSVMIPCRLPLLEKDSFDVLIIDIGVNEQNGLCQGLYDLSGSEAILKYILQWCARRKILPLLLLFPEKKSFLGKSKGHEMAVRRFYQSLCQSYGVLFFDGYRLLERLANEWHRSPESLFKDDHHPNIFFSRIIGSLLSQAFLVQQNSFKTCHWQSTYCPVKYIPIDAYCDKRAIVCRKTSIASGKFVRLESGTTVQVSVPDSCEIIGVAINMSQTNGGLRIEGNEVLLKRLDNNFFSPLERPLWFVIWSLLSPVSVTNGKVSLTVVPVNIAEKFERNDHSSHSKVDYNKHGPVVEIAGLVVRCPAIEGTFVRVEGDSLDLVEKVPLHLVASSI